MTANIAKTLLVDVHRLLDSAKEDYEKKQWSNHAYYVSQFNMLLKKAKDLNRGLEISEIGEAEKDEVVHTSWSSGTPYDPRMRSSVGSKTRKLREIINSTDKLFLEISSEVEIELNKKTNKTRAKELLQKSSDVIPELQKLPYGSDQFTKWKRDTEVTIEHIFSLASRHLKDFKSISYLPPPVMAAVAKAGETPAPGRNVQPDYIRGLNRAKAILQSMIEEIETFWEDESTDKIKQSDEFWLLLHPAITGISKSRFDSSHYADSVETAFKYINETVKTKVKKKTAKELDGASLMNNAFSPSSPVIVLDDLSTESGKNIQTGFMQIFAGSMTGIRNPKAHAVVSIDRTRAIHFLFLASLLMHKLDEAI